MNTSKSLLAVLAAAFLFAATVSGQEAARPSVPATPPAAPAPATPQTGPLAPARTLSPIQAELQAVVGGIKAKMQAGAKTEADLAEPMKGFDAILTKHKGEAPEELSFVLFMKAMLYVQVLHAPDKAAAVIEQIKTDFPGTQMAAKADGMLESLRSLKEAERLQSLLVAGAVFPDFEEKSLTGEPLSAAKYKGQVVLVDFWATWCPPCVAELPNVVAAYQKYHDKGLEIIGVSLDKDEAKLKEFIAAKGMPWAQYFDGQGWGNKLARKYGINSIPATILIGRDGKIIARDLRGAELEAELERQFGK